MILHIRGIDLFYTKTGTGPALLLVHGNGEDHAIIPVSNTNSTKPSTS